MPSKSWRLAIERIAWIFCLSLIAVTTAAQSNLSGVIDIHAHVDPDSMPRSIDAIDLARLAKQRGMRGLVLKNHYESTAALAYIVRKEVPGIEIFGGIDLNLTVGGVNPAAVERMVLMKGGWGKVVWMPTFDNENQVKYDKQDRPFVSVSRDGHLLPEVLQVIDIVTRHQLTLETGHSSAKDGLLIVHEAHQRGVQHIVVTHAMAPQIAMTIAQMQEAARDGAFIEFVYSGTLGPNSKVGIPDFAKAIRAVGPDSCILSSDLGQVGNPLHPDGLALFFEALRKEGISQAEIDLMSRMNPAKALGLP
jgi:urease gamma subunit